MNELVRMRAVAFAGSRAGLHASSAALASSGRPLELDLEVDLGADFLRYRRDRCRSACLGDAAVAF